MTLLEADQYLKKLKRSSFHLKEAAVALGISAAHASQVLLRLQQKKSAIRLCRGVWALSLDIHPYSIIEALSFPNFSYISFHTALFYHGMIEQIPEVVYAATLGKTKRLTTSLGHYSFHHLDPRYFNGFERDAETQVVIATPEKALFDFHYLGYGRAKMFKGLPELELPQAFNLAQLRIWIDSIQHKGRREYVRKQLYALKQ